MTAQPDSRNYYEVLHVSRDAPAAIIRGSYRTLMQQLRNHPDLGGDATTAALINQAYAVLTSPERRAEYDARLDVVAKVAQGAARVVGDQGLAAASARILDPYRECVFCESPHEHGRLIELDAGCHTCGSPLSTAGNHRIEDVDQRAVTRIDKRQTITFYTQWPQAAGFIGHTEDISLNGLRLITKHDLQTGQRIKIVSTVLEAVASVTHSMYERQGWSKLCVAGVAFATLRFARSVGGFISDEV
ncbi:MAG: J domain-containing protein [Gammaproteobacteria bacterium]|nr:J domain-containing protein [Gammaproteobacteria bacterium]